MIKVEDHREFYNLYFKEFNRLAVGEFADLSYGNDQPNDTAGSLESCIAYVNYIRSRWYPGQYPSILNAGAGASSWMFRNIFGNIVCADPHERYLRFVQKICRENNIACYHFDKEIIYSDHNWFDHVYYDYGDIERIPYLGAVIDLAGKSLYIDDMQDADYQDIVVRLCQKKGIKWFICEESRDEHGRFGIIIEK
jgi:hypothetical protein